MSKIQNEKMYTENPKIINFYKEHPNIDFEKSATPSKPAPQFS